jgi:beta-glucosidase-like glycosyl hydrolase
VLTSAVTYALVKGLQEGSDPNTRRILATSKHFLGYHIESFAGDGQYRLSHSYNYSETDIQQYYLAPFAAAIRADVAAVMCAYDGSNSTLPWFPHPDGKEPWGVPMCLNTDMQRLLRDQLGFKGYVISDEGSITFAGPGYHGFTKSVTEAACLAMIAGTDLALGSEYRDTLPDCVNQGNVSAARIKEAAQRVLSAQFSLGWFDSVGALLQGLPDPIVYNQATVANNVSTPEHRALSLQAAREGMVLLKNKDNILPLVAGKLTKLALVGPAANFTMTATSSYIGNYAGCEASPGGALSTDSRCHVVSIVEALSAAAVSSGFQFAYAPGGGKS